MLIKKRLFFIGGDDVNLRIPIAQMLQKSGFEVSCIGASQVLLKIAGDFNLY